MIATQSLLGLTKHYIDTQELKKAGEEIRRDRSTPAGKEDGFFGKANTADRMDGLSSKAKEQQDDRWFNQVLEESTTIHLVRAVFV